MHAFCSSPLVRACHAEPLVSVPSCSSAVGLASPAGFRACRNSWPVPVRACPADPLVSCSSCSFAAGSLRRLVSAGSALAATLGPSSLVLVTRKRWFLARPAASLLVSRLLAPLSLLAATPLVTRAGLGLPIPLCHRSVLARANST